MSEATSVAIATITRVRNQDDSEVILRSLQVLSACTIPVFVADGGSTPEFISRLQQFRGIHFAEPGANLVQQVKASVRSAVASGAEIVLYTEPDKQTFFEAGLQEVIRHACATRAAVLIAARDKESIATFPQGQQRIEAAFREVASVFLGPMPDLLYGPLALDSALVVDYMESVSEDLGWGWRPYVIARCIRHGKRIAVEEGCFRCPEQQRAEDDEHHRLYRLKQFSENVRGLSAGLI